MSLTLRPVRREEIAAFRRTILRVFGAEWPESDEEDERYVSLLPPERTLAVFDGTRIVGTSGTFELEVSIPGGSIPAAALTMVTVAQTHRRRGLLRRMMEGHVQAAESRGDAISVLWASEAPIYGRFGYGVATEHDVVEIDTRGLEIPMQHGDDALELVEGDARLDVLPGIYESLREVRAGSISRSATWWKERHLRDPSFRRQGASALRHLVSRRDGVPTGYLAYRQRLQMEAGIANGVVRVVELIALDARAEASLWRYALSIDLHPRLEAWCLPVDSALPWILSDRRRVRRHRTDAVWVRLCDVPAALSARRYAEDGELCFALRDPMGRVDGTYELAVRGGRGACARTEREPEVTLDLDVLGTLYLGAFRASELAQAGVLPHDAAARLDSLFTTTRAPWCAEIF